ncbi:MAG: prepilin-type N-terminal cleavage/methylation domain-containing protein [Myxococcaceae bacterium]|nr:prepilin-type N-terminal cleavage/methylation domain-containing protein [Myxococcaceae bacterium]
MNPGRRRPRAPRGVTLIELMVVVAIIGIIAAMSAYTLQSVNQIGRINGATESLTTVLRNSRARAITERCTYVVQINGTDYNPVSAPVDVPRVRNTVLVWRKNDCNSTVGAYVGGLMPNLRDRRVNDYNLDEFRTEVNLAPGIITGNRLINDSVSIAYTADGRRFIFTDDDADGVFVDSGILPTTPFAFTVREFNKPNSPTVKGINVPPAGGAEVQ